MMLIAYSFVGLGTKRRWLDMVIGIACIKDLITIFKAVVFQHGYPDL